MGNNAEPNKISKEFNPYQPDNIPLFEAVYGKNLISLGGLAAIDNMFADLNIRGSEALDIGFGLGGVAFYLAEKYHMNIQGVEVHPWMVQYATEHVPINMSNSLEFNTYDAEGNLPYEPETFDLVYSKGVLNHVADKDGLFNQIYSVLKSAGLFVIADWIFPHTTTDNSVSLICETQESYKRVLTNAGFNQIDFRDDSKPFLGYTKELLLNLANNRELIEQRYGHDLFSSIWKQHEELIDKINKNLKLATRIVAKKVPH